MTVTTTGPALGTVETLQDWTARSACKNADPDALFVTGAAQNRAKQVCLGCPVRTECLADALDNRVEFGVWGGMTERERRALLRRRPDVTSWRELFARARAEFAETGQVAGRAAARRAAGHAVAEQAAAQAAAQVASETASETQSAPRMRRVG